MSIAPNITCPNCGPDFAGMAAQAGDVVRCTECEAPLKFIEVASKVEPDAMKVWVVIHNENEVLSVFSDERKAQRLLGRLRAEERKRGYWQSICDCQGPFELDKAVEASR